MPRRSSCSPVSLYRLDGGLELTQYLLSVQTEEVQLDLPVQLGGVRGHVIAGVLRTDQPTWAPHFNQLTGLEFASPGTQPFGVLLVPIGSWTYALAWGGGHLLLDDEYVEQGFGLLFGIRRLDSSHLGTVASAALDVTARITQTSFPGGSELGNFAVEPYGEAVTRVAGRADLRGLTYGDETGKPYRIRVGNGLYAPLPKNPHALVADLHKINEVLEETDDGSDLRFMAQTRPLRGNHPKKAELEHRLAAALGGEVDVGLLGLAWPYEVAQDAELAESVKVQGVRGQRPYVVGAGFELADLIEPLARIPLAERMEALAPARVMACGDQSGETGLGTLTPLRKWFAFETTIDGVRYCYHQGKWFRIGEGFVEQIRDRVAELLADRSDLTFPTWVPTGKTNDEHLFCELAAARAGYLCLDKSLASTPFHPKFELCDLVGPDDELVHVKWLGRATAASHLFVQAQVSAQSIRDEPEALRQLHGKIQALAPGRPLTEPKSVVLAAAGRRWTVDQLFTLSQMQLLQLSRSLRRLQMTLRFAEIPYVPKVKGHSAAA